mgnify:CR=1 FL=1
MDRTKDGVLEVAFNVYEVVKIKDVMGQSTEVPLALMSNKADAITLCEKTLKGRDYVFQEFTNRSVFSAGKIDYAIIKRNVKHLAKEVA